MKRIPMTDEEYLEYIKMVAQENNQSMLAALLDPIILLDDVYAHPQDPLYQILQDIFGPKPTVKEYMEYVLYRATTGEPHFLETCDPL